MGDAFSTPPIEQDAALGVATPAASAPLGFFDKVRLGDRAAAAGPDWGWNQENWEGRVSGAISEALTKRGVKFMPRSVGRTSGDQQITGAMLQALAEVRKTDPDFLPEYGDVTDFASLRARALRMRQEESAEVEGLAPGGLGVPGFIGGLVHGLQDPSSFIPIPGGPVTAGVGKRILITGAREAGVNVAFTVGTEPLVQQDAAALGVERTAADFVTDVGIAATAGGIIGGGFEAGRAGVPKAIDALTPLDRKVAKAIEAAPLPGAPDNPFASFDVRVARAFAAAVPPEKRTPDQQAAINAIERDAEVKATSPFVAGPEGDKAHAELLDMTFKAARGDGPPPPSRPARAVAREQLAAGTADAATLRHSARETVKAKIHRAEVSARDDYNEVSGATGPYQFLKSTWLRYFRRRYPGDRRTDAEIAGLRRDPRLNDVLMNDLMADNEARLRSAGAEINAGNLYLLHWAGEGAGVAFLRADPNAKAIDVYARVAGAKVAQQAYRGNPAMRGTVGEAITWAHKRMGGEAPQGASLARMADEGGAPIELPAADGPAAGLDVAVMLGLAGDDRPMLRPDMFDSPEAHAEAQWRFEAERDAAEGFATVAAGDDLFSPHAYSQALRSYRGKVTAEAIGEALGISPAQAMQAVQALQGIDRNSPLIVSRGRPAKMDKFGNVKEEATEPRVMRRPPRPAQPQSLLEYLAERGGVRLTGDLKAMDAPAWRQDKKFRKKLPLITDEGMTLDDAFMAAIEAGYFPVQAAQLMGNPAYLPDFNDLLEAIDAELRGKPLHLPEGQQIVDERTERMLDDYRQREDGPDDHDELAAHLAAGNDDIFERLADPELAEPVLFRAGELGYRLDDDSFEHAVALAADGMEMDAAINEAAVAAIARDLDYWAALSGEIGYGIGDDGRTFDQAFDDWARGRDAEPDGGAPDAGDGRPEFAGAGAEAGGAALAQSAHSPATREFDDPVGKAAEAQADSIEHDLRMEAAGQLPNADDRMATFRATLNDMQARAFDAAVAQLPEGWRIEPSAESVQVFDGKGRMRADYQRSGTASIGEEFGSIARIAILDAETDAGSPAKYRLDEGDADSDLASILDEIDAAQKAAAEMRACMAPAKPKGDA